jgi:hypothetical protein
MCKMEDRIDGLEDDAEAGLWRDNSRDWRPCVFAIACLICVTASIVAAVLS